MSNELRKQFELTGYASWINSDIYPDGKIYTKEYTEWLEKALAEEKERHEKEIKELKIKMTGMITIQRANELLGQASKSAWLACGGEESEWRAWDTLRNKQNIN